MPVLIYHNSGRGAQLDLDLMIELTHHPNIVGMKAGGSNIAGCLKMMIERLDADEEIKAKSA